MKKALLIKKILGRLQIISLTQLKECLSKIHAYGHEPNSQKVAHSSLTEPLLKKVLSGICKDRITRDLAQKLARIWSSTCKGTKASITFTHTGITLAPIEKHGGSRIGLRSFLHGQGLSHN